MNPNEQPFILPFEFDYYSKQYLSMKLLYQSALRAINTKLEILNDEFQNFHDYNPIEHIKSRVKSPESIVKKLKRKNFPVSISSAIENLTDIAGIRVICSFKDDIYHLARMLIAQDDVRLIKENDYIKEPKPNGYRSLHLIVEIPVYFSNVVEHVIVEIQIRTVAMDFWASLEHKLQYKKNGFEEEIIDVQNQLKETSEIITQLDEQMMQIHNQIKKLKH